jgi:hypothetical protein
VHAIPNHPLRATLRATYELAARSTQVEEDILREAGAIGTLRIECTDEVFAAVRIQTSTDGHSFDDGRIFRAIGEDHPIRANASRRITTARDLVVMEVAGMPVQVHTRVSDANGRLLAERS